MLCLGWLSIVYRKELITCPIFMYESTKHVNYDTLCTYHFKLLLMFKWCDIGCKNLVKRSGLNTICVPSFNTSSHILPKFHCQIIIIESTTGVHQRYHLNDVSNDVYAFGLVVTWYDIKMDKVIYKVCIGGFLLDIAPGFINFWNIFLEDPLF